MTKQQELGSVQAVAQALEARRGLAVQSVEVLLGGLRSGDNSAIELGLRGLGVSEDSDFFKETNNVGDSLRAILTNFRRSLQASAPGGPTTIINAAGKLESVIELCSEAAHNTLGKTEEVTELLKQQELFIEIMREAVTKPKATEQEQIAYLFEFLGKQEVTVSRIKKANQEVLMAQAFQDLSGQVLQKIILVVRQLELELSKLSESCGVELAESVEAPPAPPPPSPVDQEEVERLLRSLGK